MEGGAAHPPNTPPSRPTSIPAGVRDPVRAGVRYPRECAISAGVRYPAECVAPSGVRDTCGGARYLRVCVAPSVPKMGPRIRARATGWRGAGGGRGTDRPPHPHHPHPPARVRWSYPLHPNTLPLVRPSVNPCIDKTDYHYRTPSGPVGRCARAPARIGETIYK